MVRPQLTSGLTGTTARSATAAAKTRMSGSSRGMASRLAGSDSAARPMMLAAFGAGEDVDLAQGADLAIGRHRLGERRIGGEPRRPRHLLAVIDQDNVRPAAHDVFGEHAPVALSIGLERRQRGGIA